MLKNAAKESRTGFKRAGTKLKTRVSKTLDICWLQAYLKDVTMWGWEATQLIRDHFKEANAVFLEV